MGCEDISCFGNGRGEVGWPLMLLNPLADTFKGEERAVAFIHMADGRAKTKDIEGTQTTDAKEKLLLDTSFLIATVEVSSNPRI